MVLLNHYDSAEKAAQRPHRPHAQGNTTPHEPNATQEQRPPGARDRRRRHGPRDEQGTDDATPEADADEGATALVARRVHVDIGPAITQHEANPDDDPGTEVEPEQN